MQAVYVDRYEEELRTASEKATFIPSEVRWRVPYMRFVGTIQGQHGNKHYYYDQNEDKYYSESDFDREMRIKLRNNRLKKYAKK